MEDPDRPGDHACPHTLVTSIPDGIHKHEHTHNVNRWIEEKHAGLGAAVQSDARRVLGFAAAAQAGTQVLIGGDEVSLAGELQQRPAVWLGSVSGSWQQLTPAVPSALAPVGGQLSRVTSLACSQLDNCWAAGWTAGRPVAWSVDAAGATVGDPELLPGDAPRDGDPEALVTMLGETPPG